MSDSIHTSGYDRTRAFTLIELLTVMSIIVLLAALVLGIANHANTKASMSRATTEIHSFSAAIEAYKVDNGTVPRAVTASGSTGTSRTDILNPQKDWQPTDQKYKDASNYLYQALSGFQPDANGNPGVLSPTTHYTTFQPTQLEIYSSAKGDTTKNPGSPYMYIVDPFGFSYGYSTAYVAKVEEADKKDNPNAKPDEGFGYNPTFDLWSTAGYATSGRSTPTNNANASPAAVYSSLWIKNW